MPIEQVVDLGRLALMEVVLLAGPILALALGVSLLVNVGQVLTSLQETTISAVPRLLLAGTGLFLLMPWMLHQICAYTLRLFSNFGSYVR